MGKQLASLRQAKNGYKKWSHTSYVNGIIGSAFLARSYIQSGKIPKLFSLNLENSKL